MANSPHWLRWHLQYTAVATWHLHVGGSLLYFLGVSCHVLGSSSKFLSSWGSGGALGLHAIGDTDLSHSTLSWVHWVYGVLGASGCQGLSPQPRCPKSHSSMCVGTEAG